MCIGASHKTAATENKENVILPKREMWVIIIVMITETTANFTINNSHANTDAQTHTHTHTDAHTHNVYPCTHS